MVNHVNIAAVLSGIKAVAVLLVPSAEQINIGVTIPKKNEYAIKKDTKTTAKTRLNGSDFGIKQTRKGQKPIQKHGEIIIKIRYENIVVNGRKTILKKFSKVPATIDATTEKELMRWLVNGQRKIYTMAASKPNGDVLENEMQKSNTMILNLFVPTIITVV